MCSQGTVGSNPTLSAKKVPVFTGAFFVERVGRKATRVHPAYAGCPAHAGRIQSGCPAHAGRIPLSPQRKNPSQFVTGFLDSIQRVIIIV